MEKTYGQYADTIVHFLIHSKLDSLANSPPATLTNKQIRYVDSLKAESVTNNSDSLRMEARLSIALFYQRIDYRTSRKIYHRILSDKGVSEFFKGACYWGLGNIQYDRGDYLHSILNYEKAIVCFNKTKALKKIRLRYEGLVLNNLGALYALLNDLETAHSYYTRSIKQLEGLKDSAGIAIAYFNISYIFSDIKEWGRAKEHLVKSLAYLNDKKKPDVSMPNICRLITACLALSQGKEARSYLRRIEVVSNLNIDHLSKSYYHNALGQCKRGNNDLHGAIGELTQSYREAILFNDPYFIADVAHELSLTFRRQKNYVECERYLNIYLRLAKAFDYKPMVTEAYNDYSELERIKGNLIKALEYKTEEQLYADSLVRAHNHARIFLVDAKFEANKKEQEIIKLQKEKEIQALLIREKTSLLYTGLGVFVFFCIAALLIYRNVAQKQKIAEQNELLNEERIKTLEKDNQLLVADSILKGQEEERRRMAKDLHDGLGGLLSGVKFSLLNMKTNMILNAENVLVFERSLDMLDHSINELRRVAHNMMPEALIKFGLVQAVNDYCDALNKTGIFKIDFQTVGMAKRISDSSEIIIYRIVQELLNNVAKHANASKVLVQISRHDSHLSITVEDNGHGFNVAQQTQGAGWLNIRSRVEYLRGKVDLLSSAKGTSVAIDFMVES